MTDASAGNSLDIPKYVAAFLPHVIKLITPYSVWRRLGNAKSDKTRNEGISQ